MTALASQVIWTRTLSLLFGATVYTFSLILAVFLFGHRHRQQPRLGDGPRPRAPAAGARLGADAPLRRDCLGRLHAGALAAVLADRSVDRDEPLVQLSARSRPRLLGRAAGVHSLGRELPARAGVGRHQRAGSRPAGRRRLRRQHRRRDRRRHRRQPADGHVARHAAFAAGAHHPLRPRGASRARAAPVEYRNERRRARRGPG